MTDSELEKFKILEKKLNVDFKNKSLLKQAFVHRSYLNENQGLNIGNNERLEFLGDAVLELIVTEHLYLNYPSEPEGQLTSWRAALVNTKIISAAASGLGFNEFLLLSRGEAKELGKARQYILANTFEAYIGALYLDAGIGECKKFIEKNLLAELPKIIEHRLYKDAKSHFQEIAQEKLKITPAYKVLEESGPDHAKHFVVGVFLGDEMVAKGDGYSKQEAEEATAKNAIIAKNWQ